MIGQRTRTQYTIMPPIHECGVCHKKFNRSWNLQRHRLLHHENKDNEPSAKRRKSEEEPTESNSESNGEDSAQDEVASENDQDKSNRGKSMLEKIKNGEIEHIPARGYSESTNESDEDLVEASEEEEEESDEYKYEFWERLADQMIGSKDVTVNELSKLGRNLLYRYRRNLLSRYKSKMFELEGMGKDPTHKKIMSMKRKLEEEDGSGRLQTFRQFKTKIIDSEKTNDFDLVLFCMFFHPEGVIEEGYYATPL